MFELDGRLANDCLELGEMALCKVLLSRDAHYPWIILVPMRESVTEIYEMSEADQRQLVKESTTIAKVLKAVFQADKINIAALGNVVSQLHIHHVARLVEDPAWPKPIWGVVPGKNYNPTELQVCADKIRTALSGSSFKPSFPD